MLSFECDYNNGCCDAVLQALIQTNQALEPGYGDDAFSIRARQKIRDAIGCPEADIYFLVGGTQTNAVVIDSVLNGCEGVVAADTGHVATHESGAIEFTGHKVLPLPSHDGKIDAATLKDYLATFYADGNHTHMVWPGMVYISFPTEFGTLYTKAELTALHAVCQEYDIPLYVDGARLGYGLMSHACDISLQEFAQLCDVFYIGGTKVGALCGEAVVFPRNNAPKYFYSSTKQHGAMLAKGRLAGVQFDALFTDNCYLTIASHAIAMADRLRAILHEKNCRFFLETDTNQQFIIMENEVLEELSQKVRYSFWDKYDDTHTVIRFCTSWATQPDALEALKEIL